MSELTAECIILGVNASDGDCGAGLRYHDPIPTTVRKVITQSIPVLEKTIFPAVTRLRCACVRGPR